MIGIDKIYFNHGVTTLSPGEHFIEFRDGSQEEYVFNTEVNSQNRLFIDQIKDIKTLTININEDSHFVLNSILSVIVLLPVNLVINVKRNASIEAYFAELSDCNLDFNCEINLLEENASAIVKLASVASKDFAKNIKVNINHLVPRTYGKVDNYGISQDTAKLVFSGTSYIVNGAIKSKAQQNARIMVFDEASDGIAKPILKIDENDIEASHAAVVGKINDEHLFYLTSRGISEAEAKRLITTGYFTPIINGFDEKYKEHLSSMIERRM